MAEEPLRVLEGGKGRDLTSRILARFLEKIASDPQIPGDLVESLRRLIEAGDITSAEQVIEAIRSAKGGQ